MRSQGVGRIVSLIAGALALGVVVLPLSAYLLSSWRFLDGSLQVEAEYVAHSVDRVVAANPEMWRYEHVRLVEFLSQRPNDGEARRIVDLHGRTLAAVGNEPPWPLLKRTWPVVDAGEVVARVEVTRSLRPILARTGFVAALLVPFALLAFGILRTLPMKAIRLREEALRESEARFRALTEHATDMILVFDAEKRLTYWSRSATETLGWSAEEVLGRTLQELAILHPDDVPLLEEAQRAADDATDSRNVLPITTRHRHKDGSWRLVEGSGRSLLHDPAVRGVVVNARDVTEQRRLEEQYRQSQKLESIGRLAGGVAHDFNNLLTVILSCSEAIREAQAEGRPIDPEDVEQIQEAGERARDFTGQLLAFARKQVISPVPTDLNAVVQASERLLRRVIGEDISLEVHAQPGLWLAQCDPGQMEQLLLNLAVNARDAMPRGGRLVLETRNAQVDPGGDATNGSGQWVLLVVRDSGSGMSPEVQERLFEPFFTTKELGKGTGLGLATVHGIVTQNGGRVLVESEPGRGTTFEIRFPRTLAKPAEVARPAPARPARGQETVLVVEDDPRVRAVTV
ncbi:MAG: PAS domain S-box protein, partial [Anaeromyxobacteraceae bacterium]